MSIGTINNSAEGVEELQGQAANNVEWFKLIFGQCQDGWLTIWHLPERKTNWIPVSELDEAQSYADTLSNRRKDVYFGMGLRGKELGEAKRGGRKDVCCITCLWADIDVKASAHAETSLPETFEEAIELVNTSFPFAPSVIVKSGNGLHAYWLLEKPWYFADEIENMKAQQLMERFQSVLIAKGSEKGWKLDNTSDLARVLRVPGTNNYKNPANPIAVRSLEYHPERRYTLEQFEQHLPVIAQPAPHDYSKQNVAGDVSLMVDNCAFIQYCRDNAATLPEKYWFAMVSNFAQVPGGIQMAHQYSQPHPHYSEEETTAKINRCLEHGLHSCDKIQGDKVGFEGCPCGGCGVQAPAAMATSLVFKAKLVLNKAKQELADTPESAFNKENISALALLKSRDKAEYGRAIAQLRPCAGNKLNLKHLEAAVDEKLRQENRKQSSAGIFEGLQYDFTIPDKWVVTEKGIEAWAKEGLTTIAPAPITIKTRLKNIDDITEKMELLFKRDNHWQTIRAERSTVYSKTKLTELANYGLPVTSETAKYLVSYLADVEHANSIPVVKTVNRLGWVNEREFIPHLSNVILDVDGGNATLAAAFKPSGRLEGWIELVKPLRETSLGRIILAAGFAAPLMERLGQRNFALHIWGDSRAGKSAAAKAALSVWGNPHQGMMTFNSTRVGLEQQVGFLSNLPLVIDEKQIVADKQAFVESMLYMLGEGKGKTRGSKNGGLAEYKNWRTLAITTGEHPLSSDNSATGIKSRVLELHSQSVIPENYGTTLHQGLDNLYGTAGGVFIRQIIEYAELRDVYESIRQKLQEGAPDLLGSHHGALAIIATADVLAAQWIFGESEDNAVNNCWAMLENVVQQLETKTEADEATRALLHFISWKQENARRFESDARYEYGWYNKNDEDIIYVNTGTFSRAMKEGGFNPTRVKADFKTRQWLVPYTNSRGDVVDYKSMRRPDDCGNATVIEMRLPRQV